MDDSVIDAYTRAKTLLVQVFGGDDKSIYAVAAPGRVNLIGEHTDYNEGYVLPLALEKNTVIVARRAPEGQHTIKLVSELDPKVIAEFEISADLKPGKPSWANYCKGMVAMFLRNNLPVTPFVAAIASDVPTGGGVSSSAALEISTGTLLEAMSGQALDKKVKAKYGQLTEHEFVNMPCGIMDQMISSCGTKGNAMLLDCRTMEIMAVPLDDPSVKIVVTNSNKSHTLSGSEYPERRSQCYTAAKAMDVPFLRDATMDKLDKVKDKVDAKTYQRGRHVITEDIRTLEFTQCLKARNYVDAGKLMYASHQSMKDDFEVSTPEIDSLVEIAASVPGVYGSRLTGGGFGGCTVTLIKTEAVDAFIAEVHKRYKNKATIFVTAAGDGARVIQVPN
mmetsp:Transcript_4089/g.7466  ORF Transcript_4089/g.7466 Transcript_4089/m.7466 type:complete len:391 (-) Transcript_4089:51-1223(-)